jgi:hypothetical protein
MLPPFEEPDVHRILLAIDAPRLFACVSIFVCVLLARPLLGADSNIEKQVQILQKKAIEEDNLNLNYPEAIKKLATAISKCGPDKCGATLKGALYRDLGAMLILNGSVDDGRSAFAKALGLDPALELDAAYKTPALESVWIDVKKKTSGTGGQPPTGGGPEANPPPDAGAAPSAGDFAHAPVTTQLVRTPLPVYAEYSGSEQLVRVVVKYRGAGMPDWKSVELRKTGAGYGGLIPCGDVAEGKLQYYIQGYGPSEDPVAASGTRTKPFTVPITAELSGPAPSLPGQEPPKQCAPGAGGGDCPPDFPGCHAAKKLVDEECSTNGECESGSCASGKCAEKKGEGEECDNDDQCLSDSCADGKCAGGRKGVGDPCASDDECSSGTCEQGRCSEKAGKKKMRRIWIGVAGSFDLSLLTAAENVCVLNMTGTAPLNSAGYQCVDPATSANFPGRNPATNQMIAQGSGSQVGDQVAGGFTLSNVRLLVSLDYALSMNVLIGARAGYVLFTDPAASPGAAFAPVHLEARGTFLLGHNALTNSVAPLLLIAAGAGEFDASIGVTVQSTSGGSKTENAWVTAGPLFVAGGGGLRLLLGPAVAATAVVKAEIAFGGGAGSLFGLAPELGLQFGF